MKPEKKPRKKIDLVDMRPPMMQERSPAMFTTMMKNGGHKVVYLNQNAAGSPEALGFYVRGRLEPSEPYSRVAKRHLMAGMVTIQEALGTESLVSIYMDIDQPDNLERPAYIQLKDDLRAGMIHRVYAHPVDDLLGHPSVVEDLTRLFCEVGGFEILSPQPISLLPHSWKTEKLPQLCVEV